MTTALLIALLLRQQAALAPVPVAERDGPRICYSAAETRRTIAEHRLADPMAALRQAARIGQAEPLRSRLCRWNDRFVYEMALLRRDGKVIRVFMNAADGTQVGVGR